MKDPYAVLGISPGATREEIKQAYHRLAKLHHPDRWSGKAISPEELHHHQETFKNITVAYHLLMDAEPSSAASPSWDDLWKRMEDVLKRRHVLEPLSHFLKMTFHQLRRPKESPTVSSHEHSFTIPVTLEDIHQGKRKKVRLLLKNDPEPIYLSVMCDRYPSYETSVIRPDGTTHTLTLVLYPKIHPTYTVDYVAADEEPVDDTSGFNLYRAIPMSLMDFFQGKHIEWLHLDGHSEHHWIPPFLGGETDGIDIGYSNLWKKLPQKGLMGKGDLYLTLEWRFPSESQWIALTPAEKDAFILILKHLTHPKD
jgi:DnaJ-class molecular chaperone